MMKLMQLFSTLTLIITLVLVLVESNGYSQERDQRGVWVTRWDYKTPADVKTIMKNAHYLGANQVFFQIRGNGTAFYQSDMEPWAWELTSNGVSTLGTDPNWDPLAEALSEADSYHLEVHGWINVFPGWRGTQNPPSHVMQLWNQHRSWFMLDHNGVLMKPRKSFYAFLSPGNPEVREYTAKLFAEVATNDPELDGLHMDYVRYPGNTELQEYRNFSFDAPSVNAFKEIYNRYPSHSSKEWAEFKQEQVTQAVRDIRKAMKKVAPDMELSAACIALTSKALLEAGQAPEIWLDEEIVDWIVPMTYKRDLNDFRIQLQELTHRFGADRRSKIAPGINVDFNTVWAFTKQIEEVQAQGWAGEALFAYSSMFSNHKPNEKAEAVRKLWMEEQIQEVLQRTMAQ